MIFRISSHRYIDASQSNILVDAAGHARITDPGIAMATRNLDSIRETSDEDEHSARWIAPEILDGLGTYTRGADVFSFAMVTIEVRSRRPMGGEPSFI